MTMIINQEELISFQKLSQKRGLVFPLWGKANRFTAVWPSARQVHSVHKYHKQTKSLNFVKSNWFGTSGSQAFFLKCIKLWVFFPCIPKTCSKQLVVVTRCGLIKNPGEFKRQKVACVSLHLWFTCFKWAVPPPMVTGINRIRRATARSFGFRQRLEGAWRAFSHIWGTGKSLWKRFYSSERLQGHRDDFFLFVCPCNPGVVSGLVFCDPSCYWFGSSENHTLHTY